MGLWKSKNEVIEEELEGFKLSIVRMKAEIHELNLFMKQLIIPLRSILEVSPTSDSIATNI